MATEPKEDKTTDAVIIAKLETRIVELEKDLRGHVEIFNQHIINLHK